MNVTLPTISELKAFFFTGMCEGWASGAEPKFEHDLIRERFYDFEDPVTKKLWLRDSFCGNNQGSFFEGRTRIFVLDPGYPGWQLIWSMQYSGSTDAGVNAFLRQALMYNYSKGVFRGGRGPGELRSRDEQYRYVNYSHNGRIPGGKLNCGSCDAGDDFTEFFGREEIWGVNSGPLFGWCQYFGGLLVPNGLLLP